MKLKNILLAVSFPVAFLLACGGKSEDPKDKDNSSASPSSSDGKESACEDFCQQIDSCAASVNQDCVESCTENEGISRAGQDAINECFDAELCESPTEEAFGLGLLCVLTELDDLELSDEAEKYCSESVDRINACLGSEPEETLGRCEDTIGVVSDELLADLNECADEDCEDVEACIQFVALRNLPLQDILALDEGEEPSPELIASLIPLLVAFGQLGLEDDGTFDDLLGPQPDPSNGMGGGGN